MHPSPELIVVIWSLVVLLVLVALILGSLWAYKRWKKSCLHLDDFKKLSTEVQELSAKTAEVREDVDQDNTAAECIKITNQELLNAADEWDQGNLIALTAWEDFIQVQENISGEGGSTDLEKQHTQGDRLINQRKNHARFMIKLMRAKVVEGIEQRKGLSVQLHRIHMAVKSRNTHVQAAQANRRLSSDQGSRRGNVAGARGEEDQMSFSSSPCSTTSKSSKSTRPTLPSLNSLNFAPGPIGALFEPRATRPAVPRELQLCEKYKAKPIEYT